jgi:hypothetical protein
MATGADGMPAVCEETPFWCHHAQSYEKSIYSVAASNPPHTPLPFPGVGGGTQLPDALSTLFLHADCQKCAHALTLTKGTLESDADSRDSVSHLFGPVYFFHFLASVIGYSFH